MTRPGRDPRAERVPAPPPAATPLTGPRRVAVIGGGIAGIATAIGLAERGMRPVLLERADSLGGRLRGWPITLADGGDATMSRGFHAFFRQYYNLRALLCRVDPELGMLTPMSDYPLVHNGGHTDSFAGLPTTPPWNAFALAARSRSFPLRELAKVNVPAALQLLDVDVPGIYRRLDRIDAVHLLEAVRFPHAARHLAFEVFSRSFFADPARLSAAELAAMFHIYFLGSSEGLIFDVPTSPFPQALWDPLADRLEALGAEVRTGCTVQEVAGIDAGPRSGAGFTVRTDTAGDLDVEAVVLAADVPGVRALAARSPGLGTADWRDRAQALPSAPPFLVTRLWLDRPVLGSRTGFLGTAGFATLDNISVLERYEDEAAAWARRTGGSVVELHAYALSEGCDPATEERRLIDQLHRVYPETRDAGIVDRRTELHADCPLFPPHGFEARLTVTTPNPRLVVAGDHVRVDLPVALMERAATSGFLAANALLSQWGLPGHELWTVPRSGRLASMRAAARWSRRASAR